MDNVNTILSNIYFDPSNPVGFSGLNRIFRYVKANHPEISKSQVRKWLRAQDSYSFHKPSRKPKTTNILVSNIDEQWSADLIDMSEFSKANEDIKYILLIVDTFSKFMWTVPLKNKSSKSVTQAFTDVFDDGRIPLRLRTDKGQEFRGKLTRNLMDSKGVKQLFAQSEQKASISERAIKTLKSKFFKYFTHMNTFRYIDVLQNFVDAYNMSVHSATGFKPIEVSKNNAESIRVQRFLRNSKNVEILKPYKFQIGDMVRITYLKRKFNREYDHKWTGEVFSVAKRFRRQGVPVYKLNDFEKEPITGSFYSEELSKTDNDPDKLFKIEKILKERGKGNRKEYYVQWLYWPKKYRSWVKASDVNKL